MNRTVVVPNRVRSMNESVVNDADRIYRAIGQADRFLLFVGKSSGKPKKDIQADVLFGFWCARRDGGKSSVGRVYVQAGLYTVSVTKLLPFPKQSMQTVWEPL